MNLAQILIILLSSIVSIVLSQIMGPANLKIQKIEKCAENPAGMTSKITLNKYNKTHDSIDMYISSTSIGLDFTVAINATVAKLENNAWREHVLDIYELNACENFFMRHMREKFMKMLKRLKLPETCPVPPGTYELKNMIFDGKSTMHLTYGDYRVEMRIQRGSEILMCNRVFVRISPRKE